MGPCQVQASGVSRADSHHTQELLGHAAQRSVSLRVGATNTHSFKFIAFVQTDSFWMIAIVL